tara:strand:- start:67 stop:846 length:780 start_codon:yes stop_codon:yes gene_type:complete
MNIITFLNHKGGVSKTCTAIHTAYGLSKRSKKNRVLVIDLDHQLNMTDFFIDRDSYSLTIENVFNDYSLIEKAIYKTKYKNIFILPASEFIPVIEHKISSENHPWDCLRLIINNNKFIQNKFDFIIIDTHPGMYPFVTCALIASTHYIVPVVTECSFSMDGLIAVESYISSLQEKYRCKLKNLGYLATQFITKNKLSRAYLESMKQNRGSLLFNSIIRRNTHIPVALANKKTVFQYAVSSIGSFDYKAFNKELIEKLSA